MRKRRKKVGCGKTTLSSFRFNSVIRNVLVVVGKVVTQKSVPRSGGLLCNTFTGATLMSTTN